MASVAVLEKLKKLKSKSPKILIEKYQEAFDQLVAENKDPELLQEGLEAYLSAGKSLLCHRSLITTLCIVLVKSTDLSLVLLPLEILEWEGGCV